MSITQDFKKCWDILGIDEYSNLSAIKSAYAKKIKLAKPDENPSEFSTLNSAYKEAIKITKNRNYLDNQKNLQSLNIHPKENEKQTKVNHLSKKYKQRDTISMINNCFLSEQDKYYNLNNLKSDKEKLYNDLKEVLNCKKRNKLKEWQKILQNELFHDLRIKLEISHFLFSSFIDLNKLFPKEKKIKTKILYFLNTFFGWTEKRSNLEKKFSTYEVEAILSKCNKINSPFFAYKLPIDFVKRSLAGLLDVIIMLSIGIILEALFGKINKLFTYITFSLLTPFLECSPLQASLGKTIFRLKVVNSFNKKKISIRTSFSRFLNLFYLMLSECFWRFFLCFIIYLSFVPSTEDSKDITSMKILIIFIYCLVKIMMKYTSLFKFLFLFICNAIVTIILLKYNYIWIISASLLVLIFIVNMLEMYKVLFKKIDEGTDSIIIEK